MMQQMIKNVTSTEKISANQQIAIFKPSLDFEELVPATAAVSPHGRALVDAFDTLVPVITVVSQHNGELVDGLPVTIAKLSMYMYKVFCIRSG